jgi:hypothetical protein
MSIIKWASDVSGRFSVAADWTGGVVPGASADALLEASGDKAYTVTSSTSETVAAIETLATATLNINGGTFSASGGTGAGANAGTVDVTHSAILDIAGVWSGAGLVNIDGAAASLTVATAGVTLKGAGGFHLVGGQVKGETAATRLVNEGSISGSGALGAGQLDLINRAGATVSSSGAGVLTIDTGAKVISNSGTIASEGTGGVTISGAVANAGELEVDGSKLTVDGAVTGAGSCIIAEGVADFVSTFNQSVIFLTASGALELAHSTTFTGSLAGFSAISSTVADVLDLNDIAFVSGKTTATFVGTAEDGVLTVTNGGVTANIELIGNYVGQTFVASREVGGTGTKVILQVGSPTAAPHAAAAPVSPAHALIQAMAGVGAMAHAAASQGGDFRPDPSPMLGMARMHFA